MNTQQEIHNCKSCNNKTIHLVKRPNHLLHLVLSVVTGGLWLFFWVWFSIGCKKNCISCGN